MIGRGRLKGIATLIGGAALSQIALVCALPIITRLYTPEDLGLLSIYTSVLGLFAVVAGLKLEMATPLQRSSEAALAVFSVSSRIVVGMSLVALVLIAMVGRRLTEQLGAQALYSYLYLVPISVLAIGFYQNLHNLCLYRRDYMPIARTKVQQAVAMLTIQIAGSTAGLGALILGNITGQSLGVLRLAKASSLKFSNVFASRVDVRGVLRENWRFPVFTSFSSLMNASSTQVPALVIASSFGVASAGLFAIASRAIFAPAGVVSSAITNVFLSYAAGARDQGLLGESLAEQSRFLTSLLYPACGVGFLALPELFTLVVGETWRVAGDMTSWLAVWACASVANSSSVASLYASRHQGMEALLQFVLTILRLSSLVLACLYFDLITAVAIFCVVSAAGWVCYSCVAQRAAGAGARPVFQSNLNGFIYAGLIASPALAGNAIGGVWPYLGVAMSIILYGVHARRLLTSLRRQS